MLDVDAKKCVYYFSIYDYVNSMKPSIKDKLMKDYWNTPWLDISAILWWNKLLEKPVPIVDEMANMWDNSMLGDIMPWWLLWDDMWSMMTADTIFSNIVTDLDKMEDEEVLKLVHLMTMRAVSKSKED